MGVNRVLRLEDARVSEQYSKETPCAMAVDPSDGAVLATLGSARKQALRVVVDPPSEPDQLDFTDKHEGPDGPRPRCLSCTGVHHRE